MNSYADVLDAYDKGRHHIAPYRKVRNVSAYTAVDTSYGAGVPIANYYASTPLVQTELPSKEGIFHGVTNADKFLHKLSIQQATGTTGVLTLYDYVSYIPFIDGDSTDVQIFDTHALPRYADGYSIGAMLVLQGQGTAAGNIIITYTNERGETGRVSTTAIDCTTSAGFIVNFRSNLIQLQAGDNGIRMIESVTLSSAIGGILALVLVKPIVAVNITDITAPLEIDYFSSKMDMPKIHKDAYLNFTFKSLTAVTTTIQAQLEFIW